jgi:ribosomal protein S18 acetylase RimI-like enzyme
MALQLRSARPADWAGIAALHVASWRDAYRDLLDAGFLAAPVERELSAHWKDKLGSRRRPGAVVVAVASRELAGFVAAWRDGANCHIDNLHVRPGLRGAGIGRLLLGVAAQRLQEQGARTADLQIFAANQAALRFYVRLGGQVGPIEERETYGHLLAERRVSWPAIGTLVDACGRR